MDKYMNQGKESIETLHTHSIKYQIYSPTIIFTDDYYLLFKNIGVTLAAPVLNA